MDAKGRKQIHDIFRQFVLKEPKNFASIIRGTNLIGESDKKELIDELLDELCDFEFSEDVWDIKEALSTVADDDFCNFENKCYDEFKMDSSSVKESLSNLEIYQDMNCIQHECLCNNLLKDFSECYWYELNKGIEVLNESEQMVRIINKQIKYGIEDVYLLVDLKGNLFIINQQEFKERYLK